MKLELSVPSKTFLLGEYLALVGGPVLLLNTLPRFKLIVSDKQSNDNSQVNIDENSPAAKFIKNNPETFKHLNLIFNDPYQGRGGFGASAAQFCLAFILKNYFLKTQIDLETLLKEYQALTWQGNGYPPSGADIVSQLNGGITYFDKSNNMMLRKLVWPFFDLSFCLIQTNNKIMTHRHLEQLNHIDTIGLEKIVHAGLDGLEKHDSDYFCEALNNYGKKLHEKGLVSGITLSLLKTLNESHLIKAAKGCGALGADVICITVAKQVTSELTKFIESQKLNIITINDHASDGFMIKNIEGNSSDEVILVNKTDQQIGISEKICAHQKALLHRAFSVFVFRKKANKLELLLQQRGKDKYHSAELWSNTCCSHPHPGEDMLESAQQRLQHEMGITTELHEIGSFCYSAKLANGLAEHEIDHVFVGISTDDNVVPDSNEVANYQWLTLGKLQQDLKQHPDKYTAWLEPALQLIINSKLLDVI